MGQERKENDGRKQKCIQGWWENLKEEVTLEDLGIAGIMILNRQSNGTVCN
jgi:hypothetical protein